jgi:chromosomal replication initiator protein
MSGLHILIFGRLPVESVTLPSVSCQEQKPKSFHDVKREVCRKYGITLNDLDGKRMFRKFVEARSEAWWRGRHELKKSYLWLAFYSGQKDHTTVLHGVKRHEEKLLRASHPCEGQKHNVSVNQSQ